MTGKCIIGILLIVIGAVCVIVSIFADCIGLGSKAGFGFNQLIGTLIGIIVIGTGLLLKVKKCKKE